MNKTEEIIKQYDDQANFYEEFTSDMESLIDQKNIKFFSIAKRKTGIKSRESLVKKIDHTVNKYNHLCDITDIAALRIITYFEDDVDKIGIVIRNNFIIDKGNSIDKGEVLETNRFGYRSVHHVASLKKNMLKLEEFSRFKGLKLEIQVRSLLQHAWAEIEHDLGYKTKVSIPKNQRRQFSRIAGLLEVADNEFISVRKDLEKYRRSVPRDIENKPQSVEINKDSLAEYLRSSKLVRKINEQIAADTNTHYLGDTNMDFYSGALVPILLYIKIKTIKELDSLIFRKKDLIRDGELTKSVFNYSAKHGRPDNQGVPVGVCIVRLVIIMALESKNQAIIDGSFGLYNWSEERVKGIKRVFTKWAKVKLWDQD